MRPTFANRHRRLGVVVALCAAVLVLVPAPAWAHAALVDSSPRQESEDANRQVINLLARLGFSPEATPDGAIALRTCPLLELAQAHPDVICQVHAGLTEGAHLAFGGDGEGVGLTAFAAPGACHLRLPARP